MKIRYSYLFTLTGFLCIGLFSIIQSCRKAEPLAEADLNEWYSGGKQTVFVTGSGAYGQQFPGLSAEKARIHEVGDLGFEAVFNSDPAQRNYGLGPVYNNVSCGSCHVADGRGKAPLPGEMLQSLLIRISVEGTDPHGGPKGIPGFGGQLQQKGIFGAKPEAEVLVDYVENTFTFPDGEAYSLRKPVFTLKNPYTALPASYMTSPRMASPVFGLGLLESISETDILANADPEDVNQDGISGKPNLVWSVQDQAMKLGRFGWKAGQPSVIQQSAGAYNEDMGITSFIFPVESTNGQPQNALAQNKKELNDSILFSVAYYVRTLAVPGRRNANDPKVTRGKALFFQTGCASCHKSYFVTQSNMANPEFSNQSIFPYSDMLLHDMGSELADNRPEFNANGKEWRTPPLWGIGLSQVVNGHNNFLHDGRARNYTEAIMWHGGEAEQSRNRFATLTKAEREALLAFLASL